MVFKQIDNSTSIEYIQAAISNRVRNAITFERIFQNNDRLKFLLSQSFVCAITYSTQALRRTTVFHSSALG